MDYHQAADLAGELLGQSHRRRLEHVKVVGGRLLESDPRGGHKSQLLGVAGVLHDIGYASDLVDTGFHPIDGARHLRRLRVDERIVNLVAHHSCARIEAELRGLGAVLEQEFQRDDSLPHDELCFCDMTTSPNGVLVTIDQRLSEIRSRYGEGSIIHDFVDLAEPEIRAIAERVTGGNDQPK